MKMNTRTLMLAAALASSFAPALAADLDDAADQPPHTERHIVTRSGGEVRVQLDDMPFGPMHVNLRPVLNAPYSAEMVSERQQNLADGNQIVVKHTSMSYRDSAGRSRQETRDDKGEVRTIMINDPVAKASWILHPSDMTATRLPHPAQIGRIAAEAARARIEQLRKEGKLPMIERHRGANGEEMIVKRVERADGEAGKPVERNVRIFVEKDLADGKGKIAHDIDIQLGPVLAGAFGDMKWAANATTKPLGSREFNGVKAEGKLRSYEIPVGAVGNRNPIVVSDETWYAPELQVTVYSKHSDPRSGESIVRLEGLRRTEPSPALFTVPADYKVRDAMANVTRPEQKAQ